MASEQDEVIHQWRSGTILPWERTFSRLWASLRYRNRPLVNFLIAGAQKGGTTALHSFLAGHPDVFMPVEKEVHFFDDEAVDWSTPDYSTYHRLFWRYKDQACVGEATPSYLYWPEAMSRIHRYNPDMKLIVLLRDPVSRAFSAWRMEVSRGNETLSFSEAIRAGRARVSDPPLGRGQKLFSYVERGQYLNQIEAALRLFDRDRILFLASEELEARHGPVLDRVYGFLGIKPRETAHRRVVPVERAVETSPISTEDELYLREIYQSELGGLEALTGLDLRKWWGSPAAGPNAGQAVPQG